MELDDEDREELLDAVNSALEPLVEDTALRLADVEASANSVGIFIQPQDGALYDRWCLYRMKDNDLISGANSLHKVLEELRLYRQSIRSAT